MVEREPDEEENEEEEEQVDPWAEADYTDTSDEEVINNNSYCVL